MDDQLTLTLDLFTVHCFTCPHTVEHADPQGAHDLMEAHYDSVHGALIRSIAGELRP